MTPPNDSNDETPTSVSFTITGLDLSASDDQREVLRDVLEERLTSLLSTELDQPTAEVQSHCGYWYASVPPICPDCSGALEIQSIHLGDGRDAFALARCSDDCGWDGDAAFKLVDLDKRIDDDYQSSVCAGTSTPEYHAYCDRNLSSTEE